MKTFKEWIISKEQLDENLFKTGALGLAATLGMTGAAQAKNNNLQQYMVHSQGYSEKPTIHHNIEADAVHIRSFNSLKETIKHTAQSKPYYSDFQIEIIESKEQDKSELIVEVTAIVNAENEQQAKQLVTRDVMSAVGKFSKGGSLQKMLDTKNMKVTKLGENQNKLIKVNMKFKITKNGIQSI